MRVTPKTDEELSNVWNGGWYPATIENAVETKSKKGADMIVVTLKVYDNDSGRSKEIKDYIVDAVAYKVKHICDACGVLADYEKQIVNPAKLVSVNVEVKLKITQDDTGTYPDKNEVTDYRAARNSQPVSDKPTGVSAQQQRQAKKSAPDQDVPF